MPTFLDIKRTAAALAAVGADLVMPWDQEAPATDEEMAHARARADRRSGVPD